MAAELVSYKQAHTSWPPLSPWATPRSWVPEPKQCMERSVQSMEALKATSYQRQASTSGDVEEAVGGQQPSSRTATSAFVQGGTGGALPEPCKMTSSRPQMCMCLLKRLFYHLGGGTFTGRKERTAHGTQAAGRFGAEAVDIKAMIDFPALFPRNQLLKDSRASQITQKGAGGGVLMWLGQQTGDNHGAALILFYHNAEQQGPLRRPDVMVRAAPLWSQAWGWGSQANAWWPGLCPRDPRLGSARNGDVGPPSSRLTTRRKVHEGPVQCGLGSSRGRVLDDPIPGPKLWQ
ncbi:hypothetical protein L3Q82_004591 [Scortum barcoo]|uniref:Uncharacterized protein n=1 Tax=Scortum barcoo TaxID=214431 RepID=A0ACB8VGG2_9TELE|nr:hypothetical protein L3Q82_004591 [Scortum barcoo]